MRYYGGEEERKRQRETGEGEKERVNRGNPRENVRCMEERDTRIRETASDHEIEMCKRRRRRQGEISPEKERGRERKKGRECRTIEQVLAYQQQNPSNSNAPLC